MPSLVKRRACPAPVGRSWTWPGELRSVVATHFPFGDKTPYPAPSPSRIAGDPSVPRLKVPYFPPVASPVSEKITVRAIGRKVRTGGPVEPGKVPFLAFTRRHSDDAR